MSIRLVPELTDYPYGPENMIVKEATPDMAFNPLYVPNTAPTVPPSGPHSDQSSGDWGVSRPGGQGSEIYVPCSEPKEHTFFCPYTRPGEPATGATGESFMC